MRVLMVTSEFPTAEHPHYAPFIKQEFTSLQNAGIEVDVFHYRGNQDWKRYLNYYPEIRRKLHDKQYDLFHAQFGQSGIFDLPKKIPLVVTFRGSDALGIIDDVTGKYTRKGRVLQVLSRLVARAANETIAVSRELVDHLPKRHYEIIPSGINLERFKPMPREDARTQLGLSLDSPIIFFGANPDTLRKRFPLAEQAVNIVKQHLPTVQLIAAKGIPFEKMPLYINAANVLVFTSVHEGSPNIVKESLACNLPVVSVDVGDVKERLDGLDGCYLCEDDKPETIARYLERALSSSNAIQGRQAVAQLDIAATAERIIGVYNRALSGQH